jgi:hypothetical protein
MDFPELALWIGGAVTVIGLIQWIKGFVPATVPTWIWAAAAPALAIGYALAPDFVRTGAGILAVSQIGYETIIQAIKQSLAAKAGTTGGQ